MLPGAGGDPMWGTGLIFFSTGSFTEALHCQFGWHDMGGRIRVRFSVP